MRLQSLGPLRLLFAFLALAAVAGFGWIATLPSKAECVASGRVVDPTERHCEAANGFVQLQEHALFHASEVVLGVGILLAVGVAVTWYLRRRRAAPAAG